MSHLKELVSYEFHGFGHENILGTHKSTFEITRDSSLTKRGDCIIAVRASSSCGDLPEGVKEALRDSQHVVVLEVRVEGSDVMEVVTGRGDEGLELSSDTSMVIRKSAYVCPRTLFVRADKSAGDFQRKLIELLADPTCKVRFTLRVFE